MSVRACARRTPLRASSAPGQVAARPAHRLVLATLLAGALCGASRMAGAGPAGASAPTERGDSTRVYIALHLQHYTGICGDAYAMSARGQSLCLYDVESEPEPEPGSRPDAGTDAGPPDTASHVARVHAYSERRQ